MKEVMNSGLQFIVFRPIRNGLPRQEVTEKEKCQKQTENSHGLEFKSPGQSYQDLPARLKNLLPSLETRRTLSFGGFKSFEMILGALCDALKGR
jgi:hypothetical protein